MTQAFMREAVALARAGRRQEARDLLLQIVAEDERNEMAWLGLSALVDDVADKIIALENALTINPDNEKARARLQQLRRQRLPQPSPQAPSTLDRELTTPGEDLLAVGRRYETAGDLEKAMIAYEKVLADATTGRRRQQASRRLDAVRRRLDLQQPVAVHTTFTWLRLAVGPVLLYGLLIFIQASYRPLQVPPLFCLGGLSVLAGSLVTVGVAVTEHHPLWRSLFGDDGLSAPLERVSVAAIGLLLLLVPYVLFLLAAYGRLLSYEGGFPF
jgi:tetratricopeptide (TPR) repeat protein